MALERLPLTDIEPNTTVGEKRVADRARTQTSQFEDVTSHDCTLAAGSASFRAGQFVQICWRGEACGEAIVRWVEDDKAGLEFTHPMPDVFVSHARTSNHDLSIRDPSQQKPAGLGLDIRGAASVEYGFIAALIAVAAFSAIAGLGDANQDNWDKLSDDVSTAVSKSR